MGAIPTVSALAQRVPSWDALEPRRCPFTGVEGEPVCRRGDGLEVRFSREPALYFIAPAPTPAALAKFYASYFRSYRDDSELLSPSVIRETLEAAPEGDFRVVLLDALLGGLAGRRALDVGFGKGHNLVRLSKAGAHVAGVDLDPDAVERAKTALHLPDVHHGTIDAAPCEAFDLITMYDLVEHPLDPLPMLEHAVQRLRPGGLLAIDTPNATHAASEPEPYLFRVDLEHMQYFSARTCVWLANRLGLDLVHLEQYGFPNPAVSARRAIGDELKDRLRRVPLVFELNKLRRRLVKYQPAVRGGRYSLLLVLQKPAVQEPLRSTAS